MNYNRNLASAPRRIESVFKNEYEENKGDFQHLHT